MPPPGVLRRLSPPRQMRALRESLGILRCRWFNGHSCLHNMRAMLWISPTQKKGNKTLHALPATPLCQCGSSSCQCGSSSCHVAPPPHRPGTAAGSDSAVTFLPPVAVALLYPEA